MRVVAMALLAAVFTMVLFAGWLAPFAYDRQSREEVNAAPSARHLLGTDALGRDRLSRLMYGGRISMVAAPTAAAIAVVLALISGLVAGCLGGWWERGFGVVCDLCLSLPWLFLLLAVRGMLPLNVGPAASIAVTFSLLGLLGWAAPSRIFLAAARRHLASDFVLQARCCGSGRWRIAIVQVLPNLWPIAAAQFLITTPAFLLAEANLSLLGLGVSEPAPSWGNLLRELEDFGRVTREPWVAAPLAALLIVVSCFHLAMPREEAES